MILDFKQIYKFKQKHKQTNIKNIGQRFISLSFGEGWGEEKKFHVEQTN